MANIAKPWAIILCKFSDKPDEPQPISYYRELFIQNGTGGVCDYYRTVTCNSFDLTPSRVFGWFNTPHSSQECEQLASTLHSGARPIMIQWGIDAARATGVNLTAFANILVLFNFKPHLHDHGASGTNVLILQDSPAGCEFGFICHEMGHGFGLQHSWCANPDMVYGDGWDLMSWQTTQFTYDYEFVGTRGLATVAINAHNLERLNVLPPQRIWHPNQSDFSVQIILDPLGQSALGNHGYLIAKILSLSTNPHRANGSNYSVEFRRKSGWDNAIPRDAVLIHEIRTDGNSYIQDRRYRDYFVGDRFITPDPKVYIQVMAIDSLIGTASIRIWDIPECSLRKEDSHPEVYIIENNLKRHIVSPDVLFAIGRTWADVKIVPDGGLSLVALGNPVTLADTNQFKDYLNPDESLVINQRIKSKNCLYTLIMQGDGNLVIYDNTGHAVWATGTDGSGATVCVMQGDGNLVLYRADGVPVWASNTDGHPGSSLFIQADRNLVIYNPSGTAIWDSGTWI